MARNRHTQTLEYLVQSKLFDINEQNKNKETILHQCAISTLNPSAFCDAMELIMNEKNCQINIIDSKGNTALMHCMKQYDTEGCQLVIKQMLDRDDIDCSVVNDDEMSGLSIACFYNNLTAIKLCLKSGKFDNMLSRTGKNGENYLHYIMIGAHDNNNERKMYPEKQDVIVQCIDAVLTHNNKLMEKASWNSNNMIDVNCIMKAGKGLGEGMLTPFMMAVTYQFEKVVKKLLSVKTIDVTISSNIDNKNALMVACQQSNYEILKLLIDSGKFNGLINEVGGQDADTALHCVCKSHLKWTRQSEMECDNFRCFKLLLNLPGINVTMKNRSDLTVGHICIQKKKNAFIKYLHEWAMKKQKR